MLNLHKNLKTKNPSSMLLVNPFLACFAFKHYLKKCGSNKV